MTSFARGALASGVAVAALFTGLVIYAGKTIPPMLQESKATLNQFFAASQHHNNEAARTTFTNRLRGELGVPKLQSLWHDFEGANGLIKVWKPADAGVRGGGRACLWPRYVDYLYRVEGTKSKAGRVFYARMIPDGTTWRIDQLKIMN